MAMNRQVYIQAKGPFVRCTPIPVNGAGDYKAFRSGPVEHYIDGERVSANDFQKYVTEINREQ